MSKAIFLTLFIPAVLLSGCLPDSAAERAAFSEVAPGLDLSEASLWDAATDEPGTLGVVPAEGAVAPGQKPRARGKWRITNDGIEIPGVVKVDKSGVYVPGVVRVTDEGVYVNGVVRVDQGGVHVPGVVRVDDSGVYVPGVVTVTKDGIVVEGGITVDREGVEIQPAPEAPTPEQPSKSEQPQRRLY